MFSVICVSWLKHSCSGEYTHFKPGLRILKPGGRIFKIFSDKMLTLGLNFNTSISANYILKASAKTQVYIKSEVAFKLKLNIFILVLDSGMIKIL